MIISPFLFSFRHNLRFYCQCLGFVSWLLANLLLQDIFWFGVQLGNDAWKENSCKYSAICMFCYDSFIFVSSFSPPPKNLDILTQHVQQRLRRSAAKKSDFKWLETSLEHLLFKGIVTLVVHTFSHDAGVQRMLLKMQLLLCSTETCVGILARHCGGSLVSIYSKCLHFPQLNLYLDLMRGCFSSALLS